MDSSTRSTLIRLIEEHITGLVREAVSVQRHSKRARIQYSSSGASGVVVSSNNGSKNNNNNNNGIDDLLYVTGGSTTTTTTTPTMCCSSRIHAADINLALQLMGSEKLYGSTFSSSFHGGDNNNRMFQNDNGISSSNNMNYNNNNNNNNNNHNNNNNFTNNPYNNNNNNNNTANNNNNGGGGGITILDSNNKKRVMLLEFLRSEELPPAPTEIALKYHWLVVDGIQPEIPQNPSILLQQQQQQQATAVVVSDSESSDGGGIVHIIPNGNPNHNNNDSHPNLHNPNNNITSSSSSNNNSGNGGVGGVASSGSVLRVNQLQASLLSEELKLYFARVTGAIENSGPKQQDAVLLSVASDPGLQELVPFFVRYCRKELFRNINNPPQTSTSLLLRNTIGGGHYNNNNNNNNQNSYYLDRANHCRTLVRLVRSLLRNRHLHLELHLHELLPALVTCVVAENLCQPKRSTTTTTTTTITATGYGKQYQQQNYSQHWILRREAATALHEACQLFQEEYPTLKARILRALCQALAITTSTTTTDDDSSKWNNKNKNNKNLASHYGGIIGITLFGTRSIDTFLLPFILSNWEAWEAAVQDPLTNSQTQYEIYLCQQASLDALAIYLQRVSLEEKAARLSWSDDLEPLFYDRLIPLLGQPTEYATCFV